MLINMCTMSLHIQSTDVEYFYHPPTELREDNVFSHVRLSFYLSGGSPCDHLSMMPWASLYRVHPIGHQTCDPSAPCYRLLVANTGDLFRRPVQTCSLWDPLSLRDIWWWPLKRVRFVSTKTPNLQ